MPAQRFYLDSPLTSPTVTLSGEEFRHLHLVMRAKLHDRVELINGQGKLAIATIQSLTKTSATLTIEKIITDTPPAVPIILAQALPRWDRLGWIVEKATELGAFAIWLFPGELSEKKQLSSSQLDRLQSLAISALKQCGRLTLPQLLLKPPLTEWSALPGSTYFGDTSEQAPWLTDLGATPIHLCIGPEKGFSSSEEQHLKQKLHASGIRLHDNILRTDTASLAGLLQIQIISHFLP